MRISLLLEREPFPRILTETLANYWSERAGEPYQVTWQTGRKTVPAGQTWLVNFYLNAIFVPQLESDAFEPVRREFGYSLVPWRRPFQRAYVRVATARPLSRYLAQAGLQVSPPVEQARRLLIVPGNHKIRILNRREGRSVVMLKSGFPDVFWKRELTARRLAASCGLPVPELYAEDAAQSWYVEAYISGTPLNRLGDDAQARRALQTVAARLPALYEQTGVENTVSAYADALRSQIISLVKRNPRLSKGRIRQIRELAQSLGERLQKIGETVRLCLAHGDFQPANLLFDGTRTWLIDWEYAARRQDGYDALVYGLQARFPHNLGTRLESFVKHGLPPALPLSVPWKTATERRRAAQIFCLEELLRALEENDNPLFTQTGAGLPVLVNEIARFSGISHGG